jgi:ASC-1-like (ASCH) protein
MNRVLQTQERLLELCRLGTKTLEVRIANPTIRAIRPQHVVTLKSSNSQLQVRIRTVREYRTIADVLSGEDPARIFPGRTRTEIVSEWRGYFPVNVEEREGIRVFEIELVSA